MSEIETEELQKLRLDYIGRPLGRSDLESDPMVLFRRWFDEAVAAGCPQANGMALATADEDGAPSVRWVLLKAADARGFSFFTNYESRKGRELDGHGRASMAFYWHELHRQVRIEGEAERVTAEESDDYYATRPRDAQIGAWASPQSHVLKGGRPELEQLVEEFNARYGANPVQRPPHWGGYRVRPVAIEFWQGRESRLHDRWRYERDGDEDGDEQVSWSVARLAP